MNSSPNINSLVGDVLLRGEVSNLYSFEPTKKQKGKMHIVKRQESPVTGQGSIKGCECHQKGDSHLKWAVVPLVPAQELQAFDALVG